MLDLYTEERGLHLNRDEQDWVERNIFPLMVWVQKALSSLQLTLRLRVFYQSFQQLEIIIKQKLLEKTAQKKLFW